MPLYEYECQKCGERFEIIQKFSDPLMTAHETCGGVVKKLLSAPAIQFKGTGWYVTDYARAGKNENGSTKDGDSSKKESKSSDGKSSESKASESKSEGKSESKSEGKSSDSKSSSGSDSSTTTTAAKSGDSSKK
jgi:putative FmdB family regulatory protein